MSDLIIPDAPEQPVGPEVAAPADFHEPEPTPTVDDAPEPTEAAVEADPEVFDRAYVEKLRKEAADRRGQLRIYEEAFEGYDPETRDAFLQFARLQYAAAQGDQEAIQMLEEFYADDAEDDTPEADPDDAPLTRAQAEEMARMLAREEAERLYAERERHQTEVRMVSEVRSTAETMGYQFGTPEYKMLLTLANEPDVIGTDDPLAEADRRFKAWQQTLIAGHTGQKAAQADGNLATPQVGGGAAPDLSTLPWTDGMSEAQKHAAVRASIAEKFAARERG